ncbi:MAG: bifunctional riboflavin kinase/FAD synthetase [Pseudomonadota bacterium]
MQRHQDYQSLPESARGATVAMGNFDGVHLGHMSVLTAARDALPGALWGCVTFEPHPRRVFQPDRPPFRLMTAEGRAHRLGLIGLDHVYELPFDAALSSLSAQDFVRRVLVGALGVAHVTVGADFRFGQGRAGDATLLAGLGDDLRFGVTAAPLLALKGVELSSTAIRTALAQGRPRDAAQMLGHYHRVDGPVEHGFKRGRELGYPTANVAMPDLHLPKFGVYAVWVDVLGGPHAGRYPGAASLGVRPQFDDRTAPNLEVFLFDFAGDLYDTQVSVALVEFLRPEARFDGVEALVAQMGSDCARAKDILAAEPA